MLDVSPARWHRAHTTWVFEEFVLGRFSPGYESFLLLLGAPLDAQAAALVELGVAGAAGEEAAGFACEA